MRVSRREFSRLGAMGLAAQMLPTRGAEAQGETRQVGYCVIGLGVIADHFMRGVQQSPNSKITGLVSGHRDKAERIAAQYGVPKSSIYSYEDMDRIVANKDIDAVYVALPNSMHAEYTIQSAKAGKHVLCEKPMAISIAECEAMIAACKSARVKLMIAYRVHYEPLTLKAIRLVREGALGTIETMTGSFGFNASPGQWRLNKKLAGGGSLFDLGIYVVNACRFVTGEEPTKFTGAVSTIDQSGRFSDVEENVSWTLQFPSGVLATGNSSYGAQMPGYFKAFGSKGWLEIDTAYSYEGLKLRAAYSSGVKGSPEIVIDEGNPEKDPIQFTREADHFSQCILRDQTPSTPGKEGLKDMVCITEIYGAAGVGDPRRA